MAETNDQDSAADIAIIGLTGRFPGARNIDAFWRNLEGGVDSISHFGDEELEGSRLETPGIRSRPNYVKARGVVEDADRFDAAFFGITPLEAAVLDPQQRLFLEGAWSALEDAGYDPATYSGVIGVWAGMGSPTYLLENVLPRRDVVEQMGLFPVMLANEKDYLATRVSYKLNLRGPSVNVYTACSTSLVAVCQAYQALLSFQCDMALAGGVSIGFPQRRGYLFQEGGIASPDGRCRPFDAAAAGTLSGDGLGLVVLKRLADAREDGDTIRAVIKGAALNNDGSGKVSFTAPSVDGQAEVIAMAQAVAGVDPRTISYVEAHGTATPLGDPIEVAALTQAFRAGTAAKGFCAIGSVKGNIGHLDAAAGVAGLIKTVLALEHRMIPPSLHFTRPNPKIDFDESPFTVNAELRPWTTAAAPRRAGVSSFGIGGTNAHVVVEEAPAAVPTKSSRPEQLLLLSARTEEALASAASSLAGHLRAHPEVDLADVAMTLQVGRRAFGLRRAVVARDAADAAVALESGAGPRVLTGSSERSNAGVAFLFPGQGSQHLAMTSGLYAREPVFRTELDGCAQALLPHLGFDLRSLLYPGPAERAKAEGRLGETAVTQPALFAVEYALARLWMSWGVSPTAMIGHSLGEYVAACLAGVLSRDAALALVATRGRLMQQQPRGGMIAVRLSAADLGPELGPELATAALNAPELTVVSGPEGALTALQSALAERGVVGKVLATSHAFHSPMMDGALAPFREALAAVTLSPPRLRFISSVTGDWITPEQAVDREYWVQQLRQPVRFSEGVRRLLADPSLVLLEVGPGHALGALVRQHRGEAAGRAVVASLGSDPEKDVPMLLEAAGRLWLAGAKLDWAGLHGHERRLRVPLPGYAFERKRHWIEPLPPEQDSPVHAPVALGRPIPADEHEVNAPLRAGASSPGEAAAGIAGRLRALLSSASGIPAAELDSSRSLLEMGFDSLLLIQVSAAIEKTLDVKVTFRQLLEELPTLGALTAHIESQRAPDASAVAPGTGGPPLVALPALPPEVSFAQQRLCFLDQVEPGSAAYIVAGAVELRGKLDERALERALRAIVGRHDALRTTFAHVDGRPVPAISEAGSWSMNRLDVRSKSARREEVVRLISQEAEQPFDLGRGPLFRATLYRLGEDEQVLLLSMHHVVSDGWSLGVLMSEISTLYDDYTSGRDASLPALPVQYQDFARWQRAFLESGEQERQLQYWRERLSDAPSSLELPTDHARPPEESHHGATFSFRIPGAIQTGLQALARREGATLFMTLLAAFQALLAKYTGQADVVVGSPVAKRNRPEIEGLIGLFVNTLVLRTDLTGDPTFRELLGRVREVTLGALGHQDLPFEKLVEDLHPERDLSRNPLFQVMFVQLNAPRGVVALPGLALAPFDLQRSASQVDLTLYVGEAGDRFGGTFEYATDLFEASTIERMAGHLCRVLEQMVAAPEGRISALTLLTDPEKEELAKRNATRRPYPASGVHELIVEQAMRNPERVAAECQGRGLTYGDLEARSGALAEHLRGLGVGPDVLVGIYMERSLEMLMALVAVLRAGGAYVPLDPAYPRDRLVYMVEDSGTQVVLTQRSLEPSVPGAVASVICVDGEWGQKPSAGQEPQGVSRPEHLAYVIYTSGSTGKPKGVAVTQRSLVNLLESMGDEPGLNATDVLLSVTTLSFDIAGLELYLPLLKGARLVLLTREEASDGGVLLEKLSSTGATVMQATPATWRLLLESGWKGTPGLKVLCGGEALPRDLANELLGRAGEVWNVYGPTETTIWSSAWRVLGREGAIPIGHPVANTALYVLDAALNPLPVGVPGELFIGGDGLARGYWNRPQLTAEKFVPDPHSGEPGARMYRTGDLARYLPDGTVECLGRLDHQVKVRGFRIELGEIEAALGQYEGIAEGLVLAQDVAGGDRRLVAYVTHRAEAQPNVTALRNHLKSLLPAYMVPSSFVFLDRLPLTPNGKVDRKALARLQADHPTGVKTQVGPRTPSEELVAGLWREALKVERISVHDNFFDLGGHSLLAMRVLAAIEKRTGHHFHPRDIVFQTLEQLAAACVTAPAGGESAPPPGLFERLRRAFTFSARPGRRGSEA